MRTLSLPVMVLLTGLLSAGLAAACALHLRPMPNPLRAQPKAADSAHWVGPAHSGSWFDPARSGEGYVLQIQSDGTATMFWFTYPPEGSPDDQAWIFAPGGVIEGDTIRFSQTYTASGPKFGEGYDPADMQLTAWGRINMKFTSCTEAQVEWDGPPDWGSGSLNVVRASIIDEIGCDPRSQVTSSGSRAMSGLRQMSAAWFDPSHNGEGWVVEEFNRDLAVIYWFTYDATGRPAWVVGLGTRSIASDRMEFVDMLQPKGTRFGDQFNAADVQRLPWGSVSLSFSDCGHAQLDYNSVDPAFGTGRLQPVRLNQLASSVCRNAPASVPASASWQPGVAMPQPQSEVAFASDDRLVYVVGGFGDVRGLKRHAFDSGVWTELADLPAGRDHAAAALFGGNLYVTGGYANGDGAQHETGWRYVTLENRWEHLPGLPRAEASGAAALNGYLYFASSAGELYQYDPRRDVSRRIEGDGLLSRDHSQLVAFQGELWLMGGRSELAGETAAVSIFDPASERWRNGPRMISNRGGFAAAANDDYVVAAGGELIYGATRVRNEIEVIGAGQEQWSPLPPLPVGVHGAAGALSDRRFWVLGGSTRAGGIRNAGQVQILSWE